MTGGQRPFSTVVLWMSGALLAFMVTSVAVRILTRTLDPFAIGAARTGVGLLVLAAATLACRPWRAALVRSRPLAHLPRNIAHATGGVAWTVALASLPFATVFALEFTAPMWVAILAVPVLGERVRSRTAIGIAICMAGVLVVLRPGLEPVGPPVFAALAAAFCFGLSIVLTRRLARREQVFAIMFWMMVWQLGIYAVVILSTRSTLAPLMSPDHAMLALVLGLFGLASQVCLAQALRIADAATVVPLDFLRVPLIALVGWAFFNESLTVWIFVGAGLILAGIMYAMKARTLTAAPAAPAAP